jgi:hypothetical protein
MARPSSLTALFKAAEESFATVKRLEAGNAELRKERDALRKAGGLAVAGVPSARSGEEIVREAFGTQHDSPGIIDWDANQPNRSTSAIRQRSAAVVGDVAAVQVSQVEKANQAKRDEVAALRASRAKGMPDHRPGQHNDDGSLI